MASSPETYLISAVLRNNDYTTAIAAGITHEMFHAYSDEWLWIERFFIKYRKTPSKVAFTRHFPDFRVKATDDTKHFVDEVRRGHARHLLTSSMRETADLIASGDIDGAVARMTSGTISVAAQVGGVEDTDILNDYEGIYAEVKARKERYDEFGMAGIPTGFTLLDERTGGVHPGQSFILGARLGEGKSATLMRMAVAAVMAGYNVHFAALEMTKTEVAMRVHNFMSGSVGKTIFQSLDLAQGRNFDLKEYRQFLRELKKVVRGKFHVSDTSKLGAHEMAAQIERHKPDIYFLDYLTLAKTRGDGGWQDIGQFSKDLKRLARDYSVAVVTAAQLNRQDGIVKKGDEMPGAESLGQSDAIGQDADAVITTRKRSDHVLQYALAKYRHGPSGYKWYANVDYEKAVFEEISYNKAKDIMEDDRQAIIDAEENSR